MHRITRIAAAAAALAGIVGFLAPGASASGRFSARSIVPGAYAVVMKANCGPNPGNYVQFTNLSKEASYEVFFNGNEPVIVDPGQTFTERLPFPQGGEDSSVFFDPYGTVIDLPNPCIKG